MDVERQLKSAKKFFTRNLEDLLQRYPQEYIAIVDRTVVFHHRELDEVANYIKRHKDRPVLIEKVEPLHEVALPSPMLH